MKSIIKTLLFSILPTIFVVGLLGLGLSIGRFTVLRHFKEQIQQSHVDDTLGGVLLPEQQAAVARAYYDPEEIQGKLHKFSWAIPNVPVPFVGSLPAPGRHDNTYINSMLMRSTNNVAIPKPAGVYRIFVTGGSTAFGSGAPTQRTTIASYLEQFLNNRLGLETGLKYEVFTLANPAWASTHERIIIENRLSEFEPDLVISFSGINDVYWGAIGCNVFWFRTQPEDYFVNLLSSLYKVAGSRLRTDVIGIDSKPVPPGRVAYRLEKNVKLSAYALSFNDAHYVYCLQPAVQLTEKPLSPSEGQHRSEHQHYFENCYAEIDSALSKLNLDKFHYFNLAGVFDDLDEDDRVFLDSCHFGDKGNELIAGAILEHIKPIILN